MSADNHPELTRGHDLPPEESDVEALWEHMMNGASEVVLRATNEGFLAALLKAQEAAQRAAVDAAPPTSSQLARCRAREHTGGMATASDPADAADPELTREHDLPPEEPCTRCVLLTIDMTPGFGRILVHVPETMVEPLDAALDAAGYCTSRHRTYLPASQRSRILRSVAAVLAAVKAEEEAEADDDA